jgi:hypothetical protein
MNYHSKYIKYKKKYLNLQKQLGGSHRVNLGSNKNFNIKKEISSDKNLFVITNIKTNNTVVSDITSNLICIIDKNQHAFEFYLFKLDKNYNIMSNDFDLFDISCEMDAIIASNKLCDIEDILNRNFPKIQFINFYKCSITLDISKAQAKIVELNEILQSKCKNLTLVLDFMYKLPNSVAIYGCERYDKLLLCLYYKSDDDSTNNCVSSITLWKCFNNIGINSQTHEDYNGKKYNKLLRAVCIIISNLIVSITDGSVMKKISSNALNPISALLLINSFNATYDEEFAIFIDKRPITYKLIDDYIKMNKGLGIDLFIDINENNICDAIDQFHLLIDYIDTDMFPEKQLICK